MRTEYAITANGKKQIMNTDQTVHYLQDNDFQLIVDLFLNRHKTNSFDSTSSTSSHKDSTNNPKMSEIKDKQALMLKTIADEIEQERTTYHCTNNFDTWISNPEAVAIFVNSLWTCKINLISEDWTKVSIIPLFLCYAKKNTIFSLTR